MQMYFAKTALYISAQIKPKSHELISSWPINEDKNPFSCPHHKSMTRLTFTHVSVWYLGPAKDSYDSCY